MNERINGLQETIVRKQDDLALQIYSEDLDQHQLRKKGNEQQFKFNSKVLRANVKVSRALDSGDVARAKEALHEGTVLLNKRQRLIKLADKSEFGWATIQEYVDDELADDEAHARKIKKAEKRANLKLKSMQEKKKKSSKPSQPFSARNSSLNLPYAVAANSAIVPYFRPSQGRFQKDIGPIPAQKTQIHLPLNDLDFEYEQSPLPSGFIQGKLRAHIEFWRNIDCSNFILDVIENGCKILLETPPVSYSINNRNSTTIHNEFVHVSILELLDRGCIKELTNSPEFCNPLHVAVQSSGKLCLILDHLLLHRASRMSRV